MTDEWLNLEPPSPLLDAPVEVVPAKVPAVLEERNKMIESVWNGLTWKQQLYLNTLETCDFNQAATLREMGHDAPVSHTISNWMKSPDFQFILLARKTMKATEALSKDDLVMNAAHIREKAMVPQDIVNKDGIIVGTEQKFDVALRANEQLAKIAGVMKGDGDAGGRERGPALVIQIVERDGGLTDVTPRGVTVDLPMPIEQ